MTKFIVTAKRLNRRTIIPAKLPDPNNIFDVVDAGYIFEAEEVDRTAIPSTISDAWYKDEKGLFYWGGGINKCIAPQPGPGAQEIPAPSLSKMGWGLRKLFFSDFWNATESKGNNIKVAVLDTGISSSHPEFNFLKIKQYNVLNKDLSAEDNDGHGTHVAGILAAQGKQLLGAAPDIELLVIKVSEKSGSWQIENIIEGIDYALKNKAHIISISGEFDEENSKLSLLKEKIDEADKQGIIVVASAGNNFNSFPVESYPAAFDCCISVGSIKEDGTRSDSSTHSTKLDIVAPGENILSAWLNKTYKVESGTSMATPLVTGIIAILKSFAKNKFQKELSPAEIQIILTKSADDVGNAGFDTSYGFGIVNPVNALKIIKS